MVSRTQILNAPKEVKEFTAKEFKQWFRGARLKSKEDFIEIRQWLLIDQGSPIKKWAAYWNLGIDGRDKTP